MVKLSIWCLLQIPLEGTFLLLEIVYKLLATLWTSYYLQKLNYVYWAIKINTVDVKIKVWRG